MVEGPYTAERSQHVFYRSGRDIIVIELTWQGQDEPVARDLTAHGTSIGPAPVAISAPTSHLFRREGTHHVYYVGEGNHLIELWWWPGGEPHHEDLTAQSGDTSLAQAATPASHVFDHEGTQHVFYTSTAGEIVELWWQA